MIDESQALSPAGLGAEEQALNPVEAGINSPIILSGREAEILNKLIQMAESQGGTVQTITADNPEFDPKPLSLSVRSLQKGTEMELLVPERTGLSLSKQADGTWRVAPFDTQDGVQLTGEHVKSVLSIFDSHFDKTKLESRENVMRLNSQEIVTMDRLLAQLLKETMNGHGDMEITLPNGQDVKVEITYVKQGVRSSLFIKIEELQLDFGFNADPDSNWSLQPFSSADGSSLDMDESKKGTIRDVIQGLGARLDNELS